MQEQRPLKTLSSSWFKQQELKKNVFVLDVCLGTSLFLITWLRIIKQTSVINLPALMGRRKDIVISDPPVRKGNFYTSPLWSMKSGMSGFLVSDSVLTLS